MGQSGLVVLVVIGIIAGIAVLVIIFTSLALGKEYALLDMRKALDAKDYQKALNLALKFLKTRTGDFLVYQFAGQAYEGLNQNYKAIEYFEKALNCLENNPKATIRLDLLLKLGEMHKKIRKINDSLGYFQMVMREFPNNPTALWNLAEILYQNKNYIKAKDNLENYLKIKPKSMNGFYLLAKTYHILKEYQKSVNALTRWFELKKENPVSVAIYNESLLLLGDNYLNLKRYPDAINTLKPLLNDPDICGKILPRVILAYQRNQDPNNAIRIAEDYVLKIPKAEKTAVYYELGHSYVATGRIYDAIDVWQTASGIESGYLDLSTLLLKYEILIKNDFLKKYFSNNSQDVEELVLKRLRLNQAAIQERKPDYFIVRDNTLCYIFMTKPYPITLQLVEEIEDTLKKLLLINLTTIMYSLFGSEPNCMNNYSFSRIKQISNEEFVMFFKESA